VEYRYARLLSLSFRVRRGEEDQAIAIERELTDLHSQDDEPIRYYLISALAHRSAWRGDFGHAHRQFARIIDRQPHLPDRLMVRAVYALCLAHDGKPAEAARVIATSQPLFECRRDSIYIRDPMSDVSRVFFALAELIMGRHSHAERQLRLPVNRRTECVRAFRDVCRGMIRAAKTSSPIAPAVERSIETIREMGLGGYARHVEWCVRAVSAAVAQKCDSQRLTPSEFHIVRLLADGLSPKEIAWQQRRSIHTVRTHLQRIKEKLDCRSQAQTIAKATALGLLEDGRSSVPSGTRSAAKSEQPAAVRRA
jgi:DNA-binding CsgD family transcriptional regulator